MLKFITVFHVNPPSPFTQNTMKFSHTTLEQVVNFSTWLNGGLGMGKTQEW